MKVKDLIKLAEANGFVYVNTRGDHRKFRKNGVGIVIIPGKLSADVPIGTACSILKTIQS